MNNKNIWKISTGTGGNYWDFFRDNCYIGIGFLDNVNFENLSEKEIDNILSKEHNQNKSRSATMVYDFINKIKIGDIIVANLGSGEVGGIGIVTSNYIPPERNENRNKEGLNHRRNVDWLITKKIFIKENFFPRSYGTVYNLSNGEWNFILSRYALNNQEFKSNLLNFLCNNFKKEFFETEKGKKHYLYYDKYSITVKKDFKRIIKEKERGFDITKDVWNSLIDLNDIFHIRSIDLKSFQDNKEYSDEELKKVSNLFLDTLNEVLHNKNDRNKISKILTQYDKNKYSKGLKIGTLSRTLFLLDSDFPIINIKPIKLFNFFSKDEIDNNLSKYTINIDKLNDLRKELSNIIPVFKDYKIFDEFSHWMYSLGKYINKDLKNKGINALPLIGINEKDIIKFSENDFNNKSDNFHGKNNINPIKLNISDINLGNLRIKDNTIKRIIATLNSGKHIILEGAPGTGKTDLAIKFAETFDNGFILTTATSDWTTFDTIGGLMPDEEGKLKFHEGKFLEAIRLNKWLIIDEINRSDIDKAFGQLFTVLSGQDVDLPFKYNNQSIKIKVHNNNESFFDEESAIYYIGKNWRIIATMNVYDKDSLFDLSYAFMRRFTFIDIGLPEEDVFKELIDQWTVNIDEIYSNQIKTLLNLNNYRKLGPAIFKDMITYIEFRTKFDDSDNVIEEAILSYIIPQFEGLSSKEIKEINKFLDVNELNTDKIKSKLNEFLASF